MEDKKIFVIGHKNPDTDSICSAIAYAHFKNELEGEEEFVPARCGDLNNETRFVLKHFGMEAPLLLKSIAGKKVILVDHNELGQVCDGQKEAEIFEVIDHHKISDLETHFPILFHAEPIGSTATIIAEFYFYHHTPIPYEIAGLLFSAILSDTVVLRSPTTTPKDREMAEKLAKIVKLDVEDFGFGMKKEKASLKGKSDKEVIKEDFKEFSFSGVRVGISQVEIVDYAEARERKEGLLAELARLRKEEDYFVAILMVTNILKNETLLFFSGDEELIENSFGKDPKDGEVLLSGVISRKKQVVPPLKKALVV